MCVCVCVGGGGVPHRPGTPAAPHYLTAAAAAGSAAAGGGGGPGHVGQVTAVTCGRRAAMCPGGGGGGGNGAPPNRVPVPPGAAAAWARSPTRDTGPGSLQRPPEAGEVGGGGRGGGVLRKGRGAVPIHGQAVGHDAAAPRRLVEVTVTSKALRAVSWNRASRADEAAGLKGGPPRREAAVDPTGSR